MSTCMCQSKQWLTSILRLSRLSSTNSWCPIPNTTWDNTSANKLTFQLEKTRFPSTMPWMFKNHTLPYPSPERIYSFAQGWAALPGALLWAMAILTSNASEHKFDWILPVHTSCLESCWLERVERDATIAAQEHCTIRSVVPKHRIDIHLILWFGHRSFEMIFGMHRMENTPTLPDWDFGSGRVQNLCNKWWQ